MKSKKINLSIFSIILPLGLLFFLFSQLLSGNENCNDGSNSNKTKEAQESWKAEQKQKGVHFFGFVDSANIQNLNRNNIEWLTFVDWGYQDNFDSPIIRHHNGDSINLRQTNLNRLDRVKKAQIAGFKVFVKPHLWINDPSNRTKRSDIFLGNEADWELWQESYRDFIFRYATIAEQANAEMFCVGTELTKLSVGKPDFWKNLIREVREIYSGKITYAANWYEEFEKITFWEDLDYIGIQAYFPLAKNHNPSVKEISKGWNKYFPTFEALHEKYNRKILFTEMGYKSTADSAVEPWTWIENPSNEKALLSIETQTNCYKAFFNTVWKKDWFTGVQIWQMNDYNRSGGLDNLDFTPQGKPAENIITRAFE